MEFFLLNYVDDFVGAEEKQRAWRAYHFLTSLLENLKVDTAQDKIVAPTTRLEFLGITFDSETMTMEIPQDKLRQIKIELTTWFMKTSATRREVESLIGKLQFLAKCIRAGRIFIARLIQWLKGMDRTGRYTIPLEARKDITWWARCAEEHNGISLMWLASEPVIDEVIASDASGQGFGATYDNQYIRGRFPQKYKGSNIALLEMLAALAALKTWGKHLTGKYFWIHVDNQAVATVINTGASRDPQLQEALREMALIAARHQFVVKAKHIPGVENRIPDWLSRWGSMSSRKQFNQFIKDKGWKRVPTSCKVLEFHHEW